MESGLKEIVKKNVLVSEEVCEMLGVTRQQVSNLAKKGLLEPIKETKNGNLYWKQDVSELMMNRTHIVNKDLYHDILGGSTRKALSDYYKLNIPSEDIHEMYIYFDERDAIQDGFYRLDNKYVRDVLCPLSAPTFVIVMYDGTQYWFNGLNSGYGGEGPQGTEKILLELGIIERIDGQINPLLYCDKIHIINSGSEWIIETENNRVDERHASMYVSARFYRFNEKLVLVQHVYNNQQLFWFDEKETPLEYVKVYAKYIKDPSQVIFLSKEETLASGHFDTAFGRTVLYQLIIKDASGKELWLAYPVDVEPINKQEKIVKLLDVLGMKLEKENVPEKIWKWLVSAPRFNSRVAVKKTEN